MRNRMMFKHNRKPSGQKPETDLLAQARGGVAVAEPETDEETEETPVAGGVAPKEVKGVENINEALKAHEAATTKGGDTDKTAKPASTAVAPAPAVSLADLVRNAPGLTDEQRAKLLEDATKIENSEVKSAQAKAVVEFNKELEVELPKFIETVREKHGVNLEGKRITLYFPKEGEADKKPKLTSSAKGNGGAGRDGFPGKWGEAVVIGIDGKETKHASPSKAAESLGLQVQGHRNMVDVFENPTKAGTKEELPKIYTVDAVKGSHFRITIGK